VHFRIVLSVVATILTAAIPGPAISQPDILPVDALTRGMKGIGRTVFHGTKIDTFGVEILGVQKNAAGARADLILTRLSGGPLDRTNGILGMSGSPVYIDGKLIGAVAWGYAFSKEALMLLTPIEEMLEILERPDTVSEPQLGFSLEGDRVEPALEAGALKRLVTPVIASGFAPSVIDDLRQRLSPHRLMPVQGGGGSDTGLLAGPLEPGSAVGVQLVRGDMSMTGIGTVTYVDEDRLIAFGHPMMNVGTTSLPMTSAFIHDVIPSQVLSFKYGSAVRPVGAITQDRAPGVGGVIGRTVDMIPVSIDVRSVSRSESFEIEVVRDRNFGPFLTQAAVLSALIGSEQAMGDVTVRTRTRVVVEGYDPLEMTNVYAGPVALGEGVGGVTRPLGFVMSNPYEDVRVETAFFELEVVEKIQAAKIEGVRLDRARFAAGDEVEVRVVVRPYLEASREIVTSLKLPEFAEEKALTLRVSSATDHNAADAKRVPAEYRPWSVRHLLRKLGELPRNDELVIELSGQKKGATIGGREMSALPPSVQAALQMGLESGTVATVGSSVLSHERVQTDYVLSGSQTVFLHVGDSQKGLRFGGPQRRTGRPSQESEGR
tara:strand:- start:6567 stop:8375 length:1809 start_codon:yes stop_codon:yes gene_type:complete